MLNGWVLAMPYFSPLSPLFEPGIVLGSSRIAQCALQGKTCKRPCKRTA